MQKPPSLPERDAGPSDSASRRTPKNLADLLSRVRTIQDEAGLTWTVHERQVLDEDGGRASLLFASDHAVRRVRNYAADWFELSSADLYAVSLGR